MDSEDTVTSPASHTDQQGAADLHNETSNEDSSSQAQITSLSTEEEENSPVGVTSDISHTHKSMTFDLHQCSKYRKYQQALSMCHSNASVNSISTGSRCISDPLEVISTDATQGQPGSPAPDESGAGEGSMSACVSELKAEKEAVAESEKESLSSKSLDEPVRVSFATDLNSILQNNTELHLPRVSQPLVNNTLTHTNPQHRLLDTHWCSSQKSPLTSVTPLGIPLSSLSTEGISKDEAGLSRTSVIFTSGSPRQPESREDSRPDSDPPSRFPQNVAPLPSHTMQRANSQSFGHLLAKEAATSSSPYDAVCERKVSSVSVLQSEMSHFPFRAACRLAPRPSDRGRTRDSVLGPTLPQIKREKCYDSSPSSSDESGSVSAGDCESSPPKDKGREVSAFVCSVHLTHCRTCHSTEPRSTLAEP